MSEETGTPRPGHVLTGGCQCGAVRYGHTPIKRTAPDNNNNRRAPDGGP